MKRFVQKFWLAVVLAGMGWMIQEPAGGAAFAEVPLYFGTTNAVADEYGQRLEGTANTPGALVQILDASKGVFPPQTDGSPHPDNLVLAEVYIGQGIDPAAGSLGKVSGSVVINRYQANKIFARIFNRPTKEDSSFYTDSVVYTNSTTTYGVFKIAAAQTDQPIDRGDDDGDGLINAWETSLGTDRLNPDSDGDGISDYQEMLAGTGLLDDASFLCMAEMIPQANGTIVVTWDSVPGKIYQLQHTTVDLMAPDAEFANVNDPIIAEDYESVTVVTNIPGIGLQHFRVRLVE